MKTGSSGWFQANSVSPDLKGLVDKQSHVPAYAQLAQILRRAISEGKYPPGSRLPAEASLARQHGVSAMTARQAVSVIVEEGLVRRVQGSGTFVRKLDLTAGSLSLGALRSVLGDQENLRVRILKTSVERASGTICRALALAPDTPLVCVKRLIIHRTRPFTLQTGYARLEPEVPVVEMMLDTSVLTGLFLDKGLSSFKKGELRLLPAGLTDREAELLDSRPGELAFKLEHIFYDTHDLPAAYGWFLVSPEKMPLTGRVGVWGE